MGITSIKRDFVSNPNIVRIETTDTLVSLLTPGYLTSQEANIEQINNGTFEWLPSDSVLIYYADGEGFFNRNSTTNAFVEQQTLKYTSVVITSSQFNGMYATPIQLVAAPGSNRLLVLDQVQLLLTYNSAAFASGGTVAVQYDSTANGAGVIASTTLANTAFQVTASTGFNMNPGVVPETFTTCVNKGLYLSNITGAFTSGNSGLIAHIWYKNIAST